MVAAVVMTEARTKNRMKKGKMLRSENEPPPRPPRFACQACQKAEAAMASPAPVCLRVGASKTIGEYVVAPHIECFLRAQPQATFSLTVDNTQGLLQALEEGRLDFALVEGYFDRSRYSARLYRQEAFFGICAPGHRLAGRTVPLEELERERLILREPGSGTRAILEEGLRRQNRALGSFPGVVAISDFTVIKTLVARGLGVSFLYAPVAESELAAGTLARFELAQVPMSGAFYLVCLKDNLFAGDWLHWLE